MRLYTHTHTHTGHFNESGITLIALVITIVILLILAGISLNLVLGDNGIVTQANLAVVKQENATVAEAMQLKVTNYNMESIEDLKTALQADGIINEKGTVNTYTLLEQNMKTGNGSNYKDVYIVRDGCLYYYDKNEKKTDLGDLWEVQISDLEETDPSLFEVDDEGTLWLKEYGEYYHWGEKTWTIENLVIPKTVDGKEVKKLMFTKCGLNESIGIDGWNNLKVVVIPEGVTCIGERAFLGCNNLKTVVIPNSITSVEEAAFYKCLSLTSISIPNIVTNIGNYAFYKCQSLTNISIPASVTSIGYEAFCGCAGLTRIEVDENNTVYDSRDNCNAIIEKKSNELMAGCKNTIIPENITSIGKYAFEECTSLTSISIPASVTSIGYEAFCGCTGLTNILIPSSVQLIGSRAFADWTSDQTINCEVSGKQDGWNYFWSSDCNAKINWNVKQ